jgi:hypothetical protein
MVLGGLLSVSILQLYTIKKYADANRTRDLIKNNGSKVQTGKH